MKVLNAPLKSLLIVALFLVSPSFAEAAGEVIEDISSNSPAISDGVTVYGSGLNGAIVPIIYPVGGDPIANNAIIHYPTPEDGYPTATEFKFTLGVGEGATLNPGSEYTFTFLDGPSLSDASINFTVATSSSVNTGDGCSDTDSFNALDVRGVAIGRRGDNINEQSDYCGEDDKTLYQVECGAGGDIGFSKATCDFGCSNGVCLAKPVDVEVEVCEDTDVKNDIYTYGKSTYEQLVKYDYCGEDAKTLYQVQCSSDTIITYDEGVECPGLCVNGVCARNQNTSNSTQNSCDDADPINNPYVFGELTLNGQVEDRDICDGDVVYQPSCGESGDVVYHGYKCPSGCSNGVCKELDTKPLVSRILSKVSEKTADYFKKYDEIDLQSGDELLSLAYKAGELDFKDVNSNEWYFPFVKRANQMGVVNGRADSNGNLIGLFDPSGQLNAAEAHKFVLQAIQYNINPPKSNQSWFEPYFDAAKQLNFSSSGFNPSKLVTRGDVACMIAEGLKLKKINIPSRFNFSDINSSHPQYKCLGAVLEAGIMKGDTKVGPEIMKGSNGKVGPEIMLGADTKVGPEIMLGADTKVGPEIMRETNTKVGTEIMLGTDTKVGPEIMRVTTLRPNDPINRAEMVKMINLTLDEIQLADTPICPLEKEVDNIRIYGLTAEPVYTNRSQAKIKETNDGQYYVQVSAWVQSFHNSNTLKNVNLTLFRHDIDSLGGNQYRETLKQVKVPYAWQNATLRPGRIERFTVEIPVPKAPHLTDRSYSTPHKYVDFSLAVDLANNSVLESLDVADNIATARSILEEDKSVVSGLADVISQRRIAVQSNQPSQSVKKVFDGNQSGLVNVNLGDLKTGIVTAAAYTPYKNDRLADVDYDYYRYKGLNPYQSYVQVLSKYFRGEGLQGLDALSAGCIDFSPVSLQVAEKKAHDDGRLEVEIKGEVKKTGSMALISTGARHRVMMKEKNSNKPWREVWSFPHNANDDGSKDPHSEKFDATTLIKVQSKEVDFKLITDAYNRLAERNENNNELNITKSFSQYDVAKSKLCKFDFLKHQDIWVMGMGATKKTLDEIELEVQLQSASGKDLKAVQLRLFRHGINAQKDFEIVEVASKEFQSVDLPVGRIKNIKTTIKVPTAYGGMMLGGNNQLGYYFTVAADLGQNKVEEIDEIGNNVAIAFVPMRSAGSSGDFNAYTFENMQKQGAAVTEIGGRPFAWRNWMQYFQSKHKVPVVGASYANLHSQCTELSIGSENITQITASEGTQLAYRVEFDLNKKGSIPLPEGTTVAELQYRPSSSASWASVYSWGDYKFPGDGGIRDQHSTVLKADVEFKAQAVGTGEFKLVLDPNQVIPRSNTSSKEKVYKISPKASGKLDLTFEKSDIKFGYIQLLKSVSYPALRIDYKIKNLGGSDVNSPFEVVIKDADTSQLLHTIKVPYLHKGSYEGFDLIELKDRLKSDYSFEIEIDPNQELALESDRKNNRHVIDWSAKLVNDQGLTLSVGQYAPGHTSGWLEIPITHRFYNLNDTGDKYYKNSQKFPLSPPLRQEYVKNKPHFSGEGYHKFIWKAIWYLEDYFNDFVALKGGIIDLNCSANCADSVRGVVSMEVTDQASQTIYVPFGLDSLAERVAKYTNEQPHKAKYLTGVVESKKYWNYTVENKAEDLRYQDFTQYIQLDTGGGKKTYLVYAYLARGWMSMLTSEENLDSGTWWGPMFDVFYYGRTAFKKYLDSISSNNYQVYKIEVDKGRVLSVKEIGIATTKSLTQKNMSKYGGHFKEFIDFYGN